MMGEISVGEARKVALLPMLLLVKRSNCGIGQASCQAVATAHMFSLAIHGSTLRCKVSRIYE